MIQSVLLWVCLAGISLLFPLSVVLWFHEHGIRPVDEVMSRFRRLPKFGQILILVFVANLIVYGSTKTNQVDGTSSPTNTLAGGEGEISSGGTGDDDIGTVTAFIIAAASLFVLVLCSKRWWISSARWRIMHFCRSSVLRASNNDF